MAHIVTGNDGQAELKDADLIKNLSDARERIDELQKPRAVYRDLIDTVIDAADNGALLSFDRAHAGAPFIAEREIERRTGLGEVSVEMLWPLETLNSYGPRDWGETINGNSLTFRHPSTPLVRRARRRDTHSAA